MKERTTTNRPFSGMLECGRCGSNLVLRIRENRHTAYICGKNQREGSIKNDIRENYGCRSHHIRECDLYEASIEYVYNIINDNNNNTETNIIIERQKPSEDSVENKIKKLNSDKDKISKILIQIYDDKLNGKISEVIFNNKYNEYNNKLASIENEIKSLTSKIDKTKDKINIQTIKNLYLDLNKKTVTKNQLKRLFDKIIIYVPYEITEEIKDKYNLTNEMFENLYNEGGLLFIENFSSSVGMAQF